jgi:hypothetical protein
MAGSDTFRGCSFQAAYCVGLALDVLEGAGAALVLEGDADVVDAAIETAAGSTRVTQAKTKREPGAWRPQQIADVIRAWLETSSAAAERFEFVTDGSLGPGVTGMLAPALQRVGAGTVTAEDREQLEALGLDPDAPALGRVKLHSRLPDGRTLLEREMLRVIELRERVDGVTVDQARDLVARLFAKVVFDSGEHISARRRLDRATIAQLIEVPLEVVDDSEPWSQALEERYRAALAAQPPDPAWALLSLVAAERPDDLGIERHVEEVGGDDPSKPQSIPVTELLDRVDDVLIRGPAGAGKSTTLVQLQAAALARGLLPIHRPLGAYTAGTIEQLLRRSLEHAVKRPLAPGTLRQLLRRSDVVLLLDGAGELVPEQRSALLDDLIALRDRRVGARVVLAARDRTPFKRLALTEFALQGLDRRARRSIASQLTPGGDRLVGEIEQRLGDIVRNPLLFTLAVALTAQGLHADSRAELFDGFVSRLQTRSKGTVLSAATRAAAEAACCDLRRQGRYSADRWWWLDRHPAVRDELVARGTISSGGLAADGQLAELETLGLVRSVSEADFELGLLHDLFCDWLASEAIRHGLRALPDPVPEPLEEPAVFLAERAALDRAQLLAVAGNAVAAVRVADALPRAELDPELAEAIWERLRAQLAPALSTSLVELRLGVVEGTPAWACLAEDVDSAPAVLATTASVVCLAVGAASSLSIAVDAWLAVLRRNLQDGVPGPPQRRRPAGDIVELLREVTIERSDIVEQLVGRLFAPDLAARVVRAVGPMGLWAWLGPPKQDPFGPPGTINHTMWYAERVDGFQVERDADREMIPLERVGMTGAERYVRSSPHVAAHARLVDAVTELLPRYRA